MLCSGIHQPTESLNSLTSVLFPDRVSNRQRKYHRTSRNLKTIAPAPPSTCHRSLRIHTTLHHASCQYCCHIYPPWRLNVYFFMIWLHSLHCDEILWSSMELDEAVDNMTTTMTMKDNITLNDGARRATTNCRFIKIETTTMTSDDKISLSFHACGIAINLFFRGE